MQGIIWAAVLVGGLGLLFGIVLSVASRVFAVERDPRRDEVREALPGANCGGCGYAGCDAYANAIASGSAAINLCPVGGAALAKRLSEIMGVTAGESTRMVAVVACQGSREYAKDRTEYDGIQDCRSAQLVSGGFKACEYGCLGLGTCERACQFDAIHILDDGIAHVSSDKCTGCKACVTACPRGIIRMTRADQQPQVLCNSLDKGKAVREACSIGCIACMRCQKTCRFDAIHVINNLAVIDEQKCTHCMECVAVCPTNCIHIDQRAVSIAS